MEHDPPRSMNVALADDSHEERWNVFLEGSRKPLFFCRFGWRRVLSPDRTAFLIAEQGDEVLGVLSLIRAWRSPYLRSPPLQHGTCLGEIDKECADLLLASAFDLGRRLGVSKIRILSTEKDLHPWLHRGGAETCTFILDREIHGKNGNGYSDSLRRNLRIAHRKGVTVEQLSTHEVERFLRLYRTAMFRIGVQPRTAEYFDRLITHFGEMLQLAVARIGEVDASGLVFVAHGDTVRMLHGGWDYKLRKTYAESYLDDWVIRWATDNGYRFVDLGPCRYDEADGAYQYKKRFGGEVLPIYPHDRVISRRNLVKHHVKNLLRH